LGYRRQQRFNALQINILSQWVHSSGKELFEPFARKGEKGWDFTSPNPKCFERARVQSQIAAAQLSCE
jgi:hypothetical protein